MFPTTISTIPINNNNYSMDQINQLMDRYNKTYSISGGSNSYAVNPPPIINRACLNNINNGFNENYIDNYICNPLQNNNSNNALNVHYCNQNNDTTFVSNRQTAYATYTAHTIANCNCANNESANQFVRNTDQFARANNTNITAADNETLFSRTHAYTSVPGRTHSHCGESVNYNTYNNSNNTYNNTYDRINPQPLPKLKLTLSDSTNSSNSSINTSFNSHHSSPSESPRESYRPQDNMNNMNNLLNNDDNIDEDSQYTKTNLTKEVKKSNRGRKKIDRSEFLNLEGRYQCKLCPKSYKRYNDLKGHYAIHGENTECCPHCGKKFSRPIYLRDHIRTHTGEKPFSCDICHKRFAAKRNLVQHRKRHFKPNSRLIAIKPTNSVLL